MKAMPATLFFLASGAQIRAPEMSRTQSCAPIAVTLRPPPPLVSVTAIEIELFGVASSRSPCEAASAPRRSRKVGSSRCRRSSSAAQPSAPKCSNVMNRSRIGATEARPGYVALTLAISGAPKSTEHDARIAPPTGTRKFLSVDWMKASSRPCFEAAAMAFMHCVHCTPYALFAMCGTPTSAQSRPSSSSLSMPRGAKHEVVESTQRTCSAPTSSMRARTPGTFVRSSSPSSKLSTTSGVHPAAATALRHDFWSMRGHTTYLAAGRIARSASIVSVTVMPVATGSTRQLTLTLSAPARLIASAARKLVSLYSSDEPAALGCSSAMSPERPMPWPKPK